MELAFGTYSVLKRGLFYAEKNEERREKVRLRRVLIPRTGKAPLCKGAVSQTGPQTQPNEVVVFGRGGANEKYRLRYLERYAVRDDEGDCNRYVQFCLRDGQRTADYNPSTSPCTGEAFSSADGTREENFLCRLCGPPLHILNRLHKNRKREIPTTGRSPGVSLQRETVPNSPSVIHSHSSGMYTHKM